jgi:hypothetical protein
MSAYRKIVCATVLLLYGLSFLLPATSRSKHGSLIDFYSEIGGSVAWKADGVLYGYEVFLDLAVGVIWPSFTWVWFANPALWVGVILLPTKRWRWAWTAGCLALVLGISAGGFVVSHGRDMHLYVGYYVWLGSMALLTFSKTILDTVEPQ